MKITVLYFWLGIRILSLDISDIQYVPGYTHLMTVESTLKIGQDTVNYSYVLGFPLVFKTKTQ